MQNQKIEQNLQAKCPSCKHDAICHLNNNREHIKRPLDELSCMGFACSETPNHFEDFDLEKWLDQFELYKKIEKEEDKTHIRATIRGMMVWYDTGIVTFGHFVTYMLKNNFVEAVCHADKVNRNCLELYAKFLWNIMPINYNLKAVNL